jgi:hypothetical protein
VFIVELFEGEAVKRLMTSILVIGAVIVTTLSVGAGPASAATPPSS